MNLVVIFDDDIFTTNKLHAVIFESVNRFDVNKLYDLVYIDERFEHDALQQLRLDSIYKLDVNVFDA